MYSDKKNILQLAALLKAHGIDRIVLCPGSRNSPITQTLVNHPFFHCHAVTDERSAGFFALGLALQSNRPVAVCCTSGTALLNIHPAVAEAFYQQIPLVVISADRSPAWIGQTDGQTLPQPEVFRSLVKRSVHLPEIRTEEDEWYCNRLINEAFLELDHHGKGPVHLNVPLSEPLFQFTVEDLPEVRVMQRYSFKDTLCPDFDALIERLNRFDKCMLITGQTTGNPPSEGQVNAVFSHRFVSLAEHIGNPPVTPTVIRNADSILYALTEKQQQDLTPDLLITHGGHIVSKRVKSFLRSHPPKEHWHIAPDGVIVDLFGSLTTLIEMDSSAFFQRIIPGLDNRESDYPQQWKNYSERIPRPEFPYSEMAAVGSLLKQLPKEAVLHLGNSSPVRYAQLFPIPEDCTVLCNRGTSGIEGSLSAAVGYASTSGKLNFVAIGDLSFFYDMNALWNGNIKNNLRILLLNNGGGEIFQALPGLNMTEQTHRFITGKHVTSAEGWVVERGFQYIGVHTAEELSEAIRLFTQPESTGQPMLLEVFSDQSEDICLLNDYYRQLELHPKNQNNF